MPRTPNPFKPSFGVSPPLLVGRDGLVEQFVEGLEDGPGAPGRATLYTGGRGSGKTVMLNEVEGRAREQGWLVISETATRGFVGRITRESLPAALRTLDPKAVRRRLTGITTPVSAGGLTWETIEAHVGESGLRGQIELLTDLLAEHETGLLITLDEIHHRQIEELRELATAVQHAFREERELAFVGAGLTAGVSDVLDDEVLTFLRRADRHHLGAVGLADVKRAIREPTERSGRDVSDAALEVMAEGTHGYPFLIQLVGSQSWRLRPKSAEISVEDAKRGVANARRRLGSLVHEPALAPASDVDRSFLLAMSRDDGPSKVIEIAKRLGVDRSYANQYRLRLLAADLIEAPKRGYVDFALPYLREYLREHAATFV